MSKLAKALSGSAGNAGESLYVEDVFSTYLYTGTGSPNVINNGIDLAGEGGFLWIKQRTGSEGHNNYDTLRGVNKALHTNSTSIEQNYVGALTSFNSNGFTVDQGGYAVNNNGITYASWTFRKAEKFFDVVTYTGDGAADRQISHNINGTVGAIIIKQTSASGENWAVYHRSNGATGALYLNDTRDFLTADSFFNDTDPTSTNFTISNTYAVNRAGYSYVAYLFASDAGGFGADDSENIIKCGSYSGNSSTNGPQINLGFEPQFLLVKAADKAEYWVMADTMRGITGSTTDPWTAPNVAEADFNDKYFEVNATGFKPVTIDARLNGSGYNYIYIAIRRPMKIPEAGTEVFMPTATSGAAGTQITTGFASDLQITKYRPGSDVPRWADRLRGFAATDADTEQALYSNGTGAEVASGDTQNTLWNTGFKIGGTLGGLSVIYYSLKRAAGFMDVVAYTTPGSTFQVVSHNLTVAPELIIVKRRNGIADWGVQYVPFGSNSALYLNTTDAVGVGGWSYFFTSVTAASMTGATGMSGYTAGTYIAYLFATLAGVSKVGSYTGTGADLNVDCGFTAGARFILIKRTDSASDWYTYDSARGISAGNDPWYRMNSNVGEVTGTDYIDPLASGFTVTSNASSTINVNGGTYIFLAIA